MPRGDTSAKSLPKAPLYAGILILDTEETARDPLRGALSAAGCSVRSIAEASAALQSAAADPPDLVILAGKLPERSSLIVRRLKKTASAGFLPVLWLMPAGSAQDLAAGPDMEVDDCLGPPVEPGQLLLRVRSLLRLKRLYQNLLDNNQELQRVYETVRAAEAHYRRLVQEAPEPLFLIDPEQGVIREANKAARDLGGYGAEDLTGQTLELHGAEAPEENGWDRLARRLAQAGAPGAEEGLLRVRNGALLPVQISATLIDDPEGRRLLALVRDDRPRRRSEDTACKEARLAAVRETAVTVNQEINNPLFVIGSSVSILQNTLLDVDSSVRTKLDRITEAVRRIRRTTAQLLAVSRTVSKEYLPGIPMLDLDKSAQSEQEADAKDDP